MNRNIHIDFLKGIGIFLVVIGHTWTIPYDLYTFIYSFHMPLFFTISGYLAYGKEDEGFSEFAVRKVKNILLPYLLFYLISFILTVTVLNQALTFKYICESALGLLFSNRWNKINFALWYLPLYFLSVICFYGVKKYCCRYIPAIACISFFISPIVYKLFAGLTPNADLIIWNFHVLFPAMYFMCVGYLAAKYKYLTRLNSVTARNTLLYLSSGFLALLIAVKWPMQIIFVRNVSYLIAATFMLAFVAWITHNNDNAVIRSMGKHSLWILGLHRIFIRIIQEKGLLVNLDITFNHGVIFACLVSVTVILASLAIKYMFDFILNFINRRNYE